LKVALCIYGQPRFIENPHTWASHKYHIIDRYNADVFTHCWINKDNNIFEYADQVKEELKTNEIENSDQIILKKYKPKKYIFEQSKNFYLDDNTRELLLLKKKIYEERVNGTFNYTLNNEKNHLSQFYSISKCINLLENEKYDWIILSRYDNYIYDFPNLYMLDSNNLYIDNTYSYNFADVLIFGGQSQMKTLDCFDILPELTKKIYYFTPEEYKRVAYQRLYGYDPPIIGEYNYEIGQEKRVRIGVGVVRSNSLENLQI
jgi:hypothetical protein